MKINKLGVFSLVWIFMMSFVFADDSPKDIMKKKLEARYEKQFIQFIQPDLYVGEYLEEGLTGSLIGAMGGIRYKMSTKYYRVSGNLPEKTTKQLKNCCMPLPDLMTYQHSTGAFQGDPAQPGETMRVLDLKVDDDMVSFFIQADQMKHGGAAATTTRRAKTETKQDRYGTQQKTSVYKGQWGLEYHFLLAKETVKEGNYDAVVAEINKALLPLPEAAEFNKTSATIRSENVSTQEIKVGMTKDEVLAIMGAPKKATQFGAKEFLEYPSFTVVLQDNKVIDLKI
ncbi:MAG: outer membrane protein assembly factor BamE [Acidobacteria bacterium]|nr:outer membrane protein assembly factor BamE [Acidobacteriota bacterium]